MLVNKDLTTTSRQIARQFGKDHKDVLKAIRNLDCSTAFNQRNFAPVNYIDGKGEQRPEYTITRDGFSILAMGFTGKEAMRWKEAFINAFNQMEKQLTRHTSPNAIAQMQKELLATNPLWEKVSRYTALKLNMAEISRLIGRSPNTVRRISQRLTQCGLLTPPNTHSLTRLPLTRSQA